MAQGAQVSQKGALGRQRGPQSPEEPGASASQLTALAVGGKFRSSPQGYRLSLLPGHGSWLSPEQEVRDPKMESV